MLKRTNYNPLNGAGWKILPERIGNPFLKPSFGKYYEAHEDGGNEGAYEDNFL